MGCRSVPLLRWKKTPSLTPALVPLDMPWRFHEVVEVVLGAGDALFFLGNAVHAGAAFDHSNVRIHAYLDSDATARLRDSDATWVLLERCLVERASLTAIGGVQRACWVGLMSFASTAVGGSAAVCLRRSGRATSTVSCLKDAHDHSGARLHCACRLSCNGVRSPNRTVGCEDVRMSQP